MTGDIRNKRLDRKTAALAIIFAISLGIRLWGLTYDLPYIFHPDEPLSLSVILPIFKNADLNPHFFEYPSIFYYLNALAYVPYYWVGKLLGIFTTRADILAPETLVMGVTRTAMPGTLIMGRLVTVLFGVATVGMVYLAGKRLTGKPVVGLAAALLLAISLPNASLSRFVSPDTFMVFFATAAFLACVLIYQQGKTRYYVLAGILAGLAISTKYNAGVILGPLFAAHFLRNGKSGFANRNIYLAILVTGLAFLAGTPYAVLDFKAFWAGMTYQAQHYSTGHAGMEGNSLLWYLEYMGTTGGIIYLLAVGGMLLGFYRRSREVILAASFPLVYYAFIASMAVRNDRTFLPLTPFLFILAAYFAEFLFSAAARLSTRWQKGAQGAVSLLVLLAVALAVNSTVNATIRLTTTDSRTTARTWIDANLPGGAKIAIEAYSAFVDPGRFSVTGIGRMIDHPADWYVSNGFDYLVFGVGMYGRFFNDPQRYPLEVAQYNALFARFEPVKFFNDGGYEIRIYKVAPLAMARMIPGQENNPSGR